MQRMLDDIARRRQERRFASNAKKRLIDSIEHIFGTNIDELKEFFLPGGSNPAPYEPSAYIETRNLFDYGINALLVRQTIEVAQIPRYIMTIRDGREEISWQHYKSGDFHTLVKHDMELAGVNMRLLTNDPALLRQLADANFNPPCPWIAFYELGPIVGSLQGNAEYWYHHVWDRFWESLSLAEQARFIERKRLETAPYMSDSEWQDWISGIKYRDQRTRDAI